MKPVNLPLSLFVFTFVLIFASACGDKHVTISASKKDFCSQIHFDSATGVSRELATMADSMRNKTGVYVLEEGGTAMVARAWLCEHAEKTIDIQYFIFATDNVGLIACDYLVRAADRGVKVRILVDDILVDAGPYELLTLDSHPNISIKIYNPGVNLGKNLVSKLRKFATDFKGANQRMHNKTFTVDGSVVITGGRNIADEYFDFDHEYNFRDRDVLLLGKGTAAVQQSFEQFWNSALSVDVTKLVTDAECDSTAATRFDRLHQYACDPENFWPQVRDEISHIPDAFRKIQESGKLVWTDSITFVSDTPGKNDSKGLHGGGNTTRALTALVQDAQHTIDIESPYLIATDEAIELFRKTVKRGVRMRILTNSLASTDNLQAFGGYQKVRKKLLDAGVEIHEFKPDAKARYEIMTGALQRRMNYTPIFGLHAKSMVVDGQVAAIGTFNLDPRSANLNSECVTIIRSQQIAAGVLQRMETDYKEENSWHTTATFNPDALAGTKKRLKTLPMKAIPKKIL